MQKPDASRIYDCVRFTFTAYKVAQTCSYPCKKLRNLIDLVFNLVYTDLQGIHEIPGQSNGEIIGIAILR